MIIKLAPRALRDLADISDYLDREGSPHGQAVIDHLFAGFERLSTMPDRGLVQHRSSGREFRRIIVREHIVLYEVAGGTLIILRVVHVHRNLRDILREEE